MRTWRSSVIMLLGLIGAMVSPITGSFAEEPGAMVDGAGFTLYGTESIKGSDAAKVERDPVCDRSKRPRIAKVEPDEAKPGDKVVISGENFGTKDCFHTVTFSAASKTPVDFKFMNDSTIEATVPDAKAGMSFIIIVAGGGSAQSKPVLIKSK
ncbi:MAG: IPT/TIG domain-containing protein [Nitrospirae bacterium]|nr:IPT/TIG domain-containing protein [Nitrospirota bacterium]MDE3049491.1 IPT/TIG domain-containing protein [Nitrospirota bacterium]